jgi:hypothetical protein
VPVVLSKYEYNKMYDTLNSTQKNAFSEAYILGTNGASDGFDPDTTGKYVLDWTRNGTENALGTLFRAAGVDTVSIPVTSSSVVSSTAGSPAYSVFTISVVGLPTLGAIYNISIPQGFVVDDKGKMSPAWAADAETNTAKRITLAGVETPYIRVQKEPEKYNPPTGGATTGTAEQIFTASVKMDCATPQAVIKYDITEREFATAQRPAYNATAFILPPKDISTNDYPTSTGNSYGGIFSIPTQGNINGYTGFKIKIKAVASKNAELSVFAYELALRTVINMDLAGIVSGGENDLAKIATALNLGDNNARVWIRGGDVISGVNNTPGFPLSWDKNDYTGIHLMTNSSGTNNTGIWSWISWKINQDAYFWIIAGDAPSNGKTLGPFEFFWSKNALMESKYLNLFPAFPGENRILSARDGSGPANTSGPYLGTQSWCFGNVKQTR